MTRISRRQLLAGAAAGVTAWASRARAEGGDLDQRDFVVDGDAALGRRFTLFWPRALSPAAKVPLVVLLYGLGEMGDPRTGVYAWAERYGLLSSVARISRAPIERVASKTDWTTARLATVNAELAARPYAGLAFACPYTPNVGRMADSARALDRYAAWLCEVVVPRARKEAPVFVDAARTHLDGCSMGGYIGLEVFLRRPDAFGAWGGVQAAFGVHRAAPYADKLAAIAQASKRALHIETSELDPFHDANVALSKELDRRAVPHELRVAPGAHDQPWLREVGTIEMLHWHDRLPR